MRKTANDAAGELNGPRNLRNPGTRNELSEGVRQAPTRAQAGDDEEE